MAFSMLEIQAALDRFAPPDGLVSTFEELESRDQDELQTELRDPSRCEPHGRNHPVAPMSTWSQATVT